MIYSTFYCRKVSLFLKLICVVGLFVQYRENEMTGSYLIDPMFSPVICVSGFDVPSFCVQSASLFAYGVVVHSKANSSLSYL